MAFSIPWLETVSKRERQRREEKAQKLMFPFGDEQGTAERAVFAALAELERPMQSMADMPDADAVARQAEQTAQELHAYLK